MNDKIDIVVYWVDGNDIAWQKKKHAYSEEPAQDFQASRYRNWNNLVYLFRGIDKFAPWVNQVFFVTDGQVPEWMDTGCSKLEIVDHSDFIPGQYLPVFSSHPIELNFHRIKGLSETFIVMNDDCFFISPVRSTDFFVDGKPVDILMEYPIMCDGSNTIFPHILANDFSVIGRHFKRRKYRKELRGKILSLRYGRYFFYNLLTYIIPYPKFYGVLSPHLARPCLKSTFQEVWEKEYEILDRTCHNRFRDAADVNIYLMRIWNLLKGNFVPGNVLGMGEAFFVHDVNEQVCQAIERQRLKMVCINDECDDRAARIMIKKVNRSFQKILPDKSVFEK